MHAKTIITSWEPQMNVAEMRREPTVETLRVGTVDKRLKVIAIPVSDIDRAKRFYRDLGWRLDIDYAPGADFRMIQFTPPGAGCSVIFGKNVSAAAPGSAQGLHLIVADIEAARDELLRRGVEISEPFHDAGGVFHHAGVEGQRNGPNPQQNGYAWYASFSDPEGNGWLLQQVTERLPAHLDTGDISFTTGLAIAVRGAEASRRRCAISQ